MKDISTDTPILKAARYQIQVCDNIAAAYGERAARRSRQGKFFDVSAPLLTATGAATTAAASLFDADTGERTALTWGGIIVSALGAGLAVSHVFTGSERAEVYSKAASSVSDATTAFRAALRANDLNTEDPNVLKERICSLRSTCFQQQGDLQPVGTPFSTRIAGDPTLQAEFNELPLVDEYVTAFCSQPSTKTGTDVAACLASGAERSASCTEAICEAALLDKADPKAIETCRAWSIQRQSLGAPAPTDPAQAKVGSQSPSEDPKNRVPELIR